MKTYCFSYSTDNAINCLPLAVKASRLDSALRTFLAVVPSYSDFYRLEVFNYTVEVNGKKQHRHLDCLHIYLLVDGKCVRWFEEGVY